MGQTKYDPGYDNRRPWNVGKFVGAKRPLTPKQVWPEKPEGCGFTSSGNRICAISRCSTWLVVCKLRGCDVVAIRIGDVVGGGGKVKAHAMVVQKKTGRPVQFELTEPARNSLTNWLERRGGTLADYAFPSRVHPEGHLSTRQYARLVDEWIIAIGLRPEDYGTHSLRRTKPSIITKRTGNLRAVQMLLGHSRIETNVPRLGVDMEDALSLAEATEI